MFFSQVARSFRTIPAYKSAPRFGRFRTQREQQRGFRGAPAKQKTAVPPGADSFAFAVLESESSWKRGTNDNIVDGTLGQRSRDNVARPV